MRQQWYDNIREKAKQYDSLEAALTDADTVLDRNNDYPRVIALFKSGTARYDWFCNVFRYPDGRIGHTTVTYMAC